MQLEGISPDAFTFTSILKVCGSIWSLDKGQKVHGEIIKEGLLFLDKGRLIGIALVDMYGKCRALAKAQEVFDNLQDQDGIAWNVLIANYAEHEHVEEDWNGFYLWPARACLQMQLLLLLSSWRRYEFSLQSC